MEQSENLKKVRLPFKCIEMTNGNTVGLFQYENAASFIFKRADTNVETHVSLSNEAIICMLRLIAQYSVCKTSNGTEFRIKLVSDNEIFSIPRFDIKEIPFEISL